MKKYLIILLSLLVGCGAKQSTDNILAEVWAKDQGIRQQIMRLSKAVSVEGKTELIDSLIWASEQEERIDAENMAIVEKVIEESIPKGLSAESYKTIWIVIDHSSLEKQEQYLPLIEQMSAEGLIARDKYPILFDRIAMKRNQPQRYGSQTIQFGTVGRCSSICGPWRVPKIWIHCAPRSGCRPLPTISKH